MKLLKLLKLQIWVSLTCLPLCLAAVDESLGKGVCSPDGEPENRAPDLGRGSQRTLEFIKRELRDTLKLNCVLYLKMEEQDMHSFDWQPGKLKNATGVIKVEIGSAL
ncbi:hypothetical protein STEG23_037002 [Scotinomys teguina]